MLWGSEALGLEKYKIVCEIELEKARNQTEKEKARIQTEKGVELRKLEVGAISNMYRTCEGTDGRIRNIPDFTEIGAENFPCSLRR